MQTGRTLGKSNVEIGLNASYGKYSQNSVLDNEGDFDYYPVVGISGKYGASDNLDVGISINQTSFIGGNTKYQFIGNKQSYFAGSIGLSAGFNFGTFLFGNFTHYVTVPLFLSYHPTTYISVYLTPRYIYTSEYIFAHPAGGQLGTIESINRVGSAYGLIIGDKHKIAMEVANFGKYPYHPIQFSLGYIYTFGQ